MAGARSRRTPFRTRMPAAALALLLSLAVAGPAAVAGTSATSSPTPAPSAPAPVYPSATDGPAQQRDPHVDPEEADTPSPGNFVADDGRIVPGVGWLTESLDQAILWALRPRVDQRRLIHVARGLPLDGRKVMLTVDEADPGATPEQMRQDAEATADAMVTEYRTGMTVDHWTPGSSTRPRLDPGWVMLTVMVPAADATADPVVVLELGQGVTLAAEDSAAVVEGAALDALSEQELTDGLEELVRAAVDQTVPPPEGAGLSWTSWTGGPLTPGRVVLAVLLVGGLVAIAVVPRVLAARRRRRDSGVTAHAAQPEWYADTAGDPALRLRRIVEALGLALDAPGARSLPSAGAAQAAIVEHTLELDRLAPRSRQGRTTPIRPSGRRVLRARVADAEQLLAGLVEEGQGARRTVRFPVEVRQVLAERGTPASGTQTPGRTRR